MTDIRPASPIPVKYAEEDINVAPVDPLDQTAIDHDYFTKSRSTRFYRSVLMQMLMFGA